MTTQNLLQYPLTTQKLTLGCPVLDRHFGGGIPSNSITEIVAESGSGKTQLCLQLALSAQLPTSLGGLSASSLFLHSEFSFPSRRLHQLSLSFRSSHPQIFTSNDGNNVNPCDRIFVHSVHSADQLLDLIPKIKSFVENPNTQFPVRLIVIDSVAALFRSEFENTPSDLKRRSSLFFKISGKLKALANRFGMVVVVTNQVVDLVGHEGGNGVRVGNLGSMYSSGRLVCPALGLAWANCVNSRLCLLKNEEAVGEERGLVDGGAADFVYRRTRRWLHVVFAPHLPDSSCEFVIKREGIFGVDR